jgi:hypothetical protein
VIPFSQSYRPIEQARITLGQFSPFIDPVGVTGDLTPMTPPSAAPAGPVKTAVVLAGVAMTALSAATAYVGMSYGLDKRNKNLQRALGWTVGVVGALSGLARLATTTAVLFMDVPTSSRPLAGRKV